MQKEPSGHIRIAIPPSLLHFHDFSREIIRYMGEFPKVSIEKYATRSSTLIELAQRCDGQFTEDSSRFFHSHTVKLKNS